MEQEEGSQERSTTEGEMPTNQLETTEETIRVENVSVEAEDENDSSDGEDLLTMLADAATDQSSTEDLSRVCKDTNNQDTMLETSAGEILHQRDEDSLQIEKQASEPSPDNEVVSVEEDVKIEEPESQQTADSVTQETTDFVKQEEAEVSLKEEVPPDVVRIRSASTIVEDAINFGEREGRQIIVAGTLNKLVEHVAYEGDMQDKDFLHHFLITHRYFTDSITFLDLLMELRFNLQAPGSGSDFETKAQIIRMRTVNVLKKWIETCSSDFDDKLIARLNYHLETIKTVNEKWADVLKTQLGSRIQQKGGGVSFSVSGETPKPAPLPKSLKSGEISIMDIPAIETARQLTLIESFMFRQIPKDEYLNKGFNNPELAPYMNSLIKRFNDVTSWIASEILNRETPKERAAVIVRFLEIGQHFFKDLNNFNGVMEVFSSLSITPISRLKQTWKLLSEKHKKIYDEFENLMDPKGNYKIYRGLLKSLQSKLPLLPFQGVYLQDLTFIEENTDRLENGLVNFEKMHMLGRLLTEVMHFQSVAYNLETVPIIRDWLFSRPTSYTEDELYKRSRELEPPPAPIPTTPGQVPEPPAAPKKHGFLNRMRSLSMKDLKQDKAVVDAKLSLSNLAPPGQAITEDKTTEDSPRVRKLSAADRMKGFKLSSSATSIDKEKKEKEDEKEKVTQDASGTVSAVPLPTTPEVTVVNPLYRRSKTKVGTPPLPSAAPRSDESPSPALEKTTEKASPRSRSNSTEASVSGSPKHAQILSTAAAAGQPRVRSSTSPNPKLKETAAMTKKKIGKSSKIVMK